MTIPIRQYAVLLAKYLRQHQVKVGGLSLLLLGSIGLQVIPPRLMQRFIDAAMAGDPPPQLTKLALLLIGAVLVQQLIAVAATYLSEEVAWTATNGLRVELMAHCLHLDMAFHHGRTPGEMIERLDSDVTGLANFFSQFVIQIVGNGLLIVGVLVLLFGVEWRVGLAAALFVLIAFSVLVRLRHMIVPYAAAERQSSAELFGYLEERLGGLEEIQANGATAYILSRFYPLMRDYFRRQLKGNWVHGLLFATITLLFAVGTASALGVSAFLFQNQAITVGTIYLVFQYTAMLANPINTITHQIEDLQQAGASMIRVSELQQARSKIQAVAGRMGEEDRRSPIVSTAPERKSEPLAVSFDQVSFGYGDGAILQQISFQLKPGQVLGLLGRTGSGKTTLTRLLFRLYDPDQGAIRLGPSLDGDACDLRQIPLRRLRQQVGLVTQNVQLFHASLRDNLTFWDRAIADERLQQILAQFGLSAWFQGLPAGFDTILTAEGGGFSAGEAQLLAFIRIFLRDPGLVILDEAASRLDPATERRLERAVDRLLQQRTGIIIAHRLATVRRADLILILEEGRIREFGERTALENDPASRYYRLLQTGLEAVLT